MCGNQLGDNVMKASVECYPCLLSQILKTSELCGLDGAAKKKVMNFALQTMADLPADIYPHEIVVAVNEHIKTTYCSSDDVFDPYIDLKNQTREIAETFYTSIEQKIDQGPDSLEMAVKCAALGNIIDFGAKSHGNLDVKHELEKIDTLDFAIYDYQPFIESLERARLILYLGDNVGEDIFDKVFITEIQKEYPDKRIIFAVRDQPVINDVTLADALAIGMDRLVEIISSGSIYPGTILSKTSEKFQELFRTSDLIISKGQGNFETLCSEEHPHLFFFLRAKCEKVAKYLDVDLNSMILKKLATDRTSDLVHLENLSAYHNVAFASKENGFAGLDTELSFNGPVQVKHIQTMGDWAKEGKFIYGGRRNESGARFRAGECALYTESSAGYAGVKNEATFEFNIRPLPYWEGVEGAPQNTIIGGASLWVMAGQTEPEYKGVARFIEFLSSPAIQAKWHQDTGYLPITITAYELTKEEGFYKSNPGTDVAIIQMTANEPTAHSKGLRLGYFDQIRGIIDEELEAVWSGDKTAEAALNTAVERGNQLLRRFEKANR